MSSVETMLAQCKGKQEDEPEPVPRPALESVRRPTHARGAIVVMRPGALDYQKYPSLAGGQRIPYRSGGHLTEGSDGDA